MNSKLGAFGFVGLISLFTLVGCASEQVEGADLDTTNSALEADRAEKCNTCVSDYHACLVTPGGHETCGTVFVACYETNHC